MHIGQHFSFYVKLFLQKIFGIEPAITLDFVVIKIDLRPL